MTGDAGKVAGDFYSYLFTACPGLREMFPPAMAQQNERLFAALLKIVQLIDQPASLARYLGQLGADHRKFGVEPAHYAPVGDALIRTLRRHCPAWDDKADAAWRAAYSAAASLMITGARRQAGPATWGGRVVAHERRSRDLAVLTVVPDEPYLYQAGQYASIQHGKWPRVWRSFSIACAPRVNGVLKLHVRAIPGGWVSTALVRDTAVNDKLIIGPPVGAMTSSAANCRDLLCIAGGTGLAPLKAIVEDVLWHDEHAVTAGTGRRRNITLFHGARNRLGLYDMPELRRLAGIYPWLQVVPVVSDDPEFDGLRGEVADVALGYSDWTGQEAFISGPPAMTERALSGLRELGAGENQVHFDPPRASR